MELLLAALDNTLLCRTNHKKDKLVISSQTVENAKEYATTLLLFALVNKTINLFI